MATMGQFEEGNFGNGLLPPLRELFLEIQVNKLIEEYLFSSTADELPTSLCDGGNGSLEYKESKAWFMPPDQLHAKDAVLQSACNAPCLQSTRALNDVHIQCPHELHSLHKSTSASNDLSLQSSQEPHSLHGITCIQDRNISLKEQTLPDNAQILQPVNAACDLSLLMEVEGKILQKTSHLSRVDTFPYTKKVELQVGAPCKVDTDVKPSFKKPPRPPRLPKLPSDELSPSLTRCSSDSGALLQSSRRFKLERKRKATAASSVNTSMWALLFTFCFAVIMIAQGFLSQGGYTSNGSDASSPMEAYMKAPGEGSLVGTKGGKASIERAPVQSYVMMKVQAQHLSDMKHLEIDDTFSKS